MEKGRWVPNISRQWIISWRHLTEIYLVLTKGVPKFGITFYCRKKGIFSALKFSWRNTLVKSTSGYHTVTKEILLINSEDHDNKNACWFGKYNYFKHKNSKHFGISSCQYFFHYQNKDILENVTKVERAFPQILIKNVQGCLDMKLYVTLTNEWLALSVPDEGYSRNVSCKLNLISMF